MVTTLVPEEAKARKVTAQTQELVLHRVSKLFHSNHQGEILAVEDISLSLREGEFVCLVGPSGCGKSTLLNMVAGFLKPDSGSVTFRGKPIAAPGSDRMMVFQDAALFPWLDVMGNVLFGLKLIPKLTGKQRRELAAFHLRMVGLEKFTRAYIHELSGGMRQRVSLARALAPNPRMLLMDEPFGSLDALTREQLYADIQRIWERHRKTILFVTHNVREAVCLGDRVVLLSPCPGRIQEQFVIDLPRPRNINSVDLAAHSTAITRALKRYLIPDIGEVAE